MNQKTSNTFFIVLTFLLIAISDIHSQNDESKENWKELSKNKFFTTYYDLTSLATAKSDVFDQLIKTEYKSEQNMKGLSQKYFTEILVYSINLKEAKYYIKRATYLNRKKQGIKVFDYSTDDKIEPKQMLPITKGSPVFTIFLLHRAIHSKN
jgi:hypothetical protein